MGKSETGFSFFLSIFHYTDTIYIYIFLRLTLSVRLEQRTNEQPHSSHNTIIMIILWMYKNNNNNSSSTTAKLNVSKKVYN